jgi:hypothetical protein
MNEAELFSSDLSFRAHSSKKGAMIGDESKQNEDVIQFVTERLKKFTKKYKQDLKEFHLTVKTDES